MTYMRAQSCRNSLQATPPQIRTLGSLPGIKQFDHIDPKRRCDPLQDQDRRISHTALNARYVAAVKAAVGGKVFRIELARRP
jgi:hypothetical protein